MEKMTQQQAVEILSSDTFINYNVDELLEAVELLKGDVTQKDLVEKFYKKYNNYVDENLNDFSQYPTIKQIFADTEYAEKVQKNANDRANNVALVINGGEEPSSFKDINNIQALFNFAEQTPDIEKATAKLEKVAELKIEAMIIDNDTVDIFDLPYAQKLVDNIKDEDKKSRAQEKLNQVLEIYKEENGLNAKKEVMRKNDASLDEELKSIHLYNDDNSISEDFADLKKLVANIEVKDDENNEEANLDTENTFQHINMLFEAAKLEAYQESVGSLKYLMASKKEQKEQLTAKIKDHFVAKVGEAGIASSFAAPTVEEQQDENKFKAYIERREKAAKEFINNVINTGKKVTIKVKDIITACAETDINVTKFKEVLEASMGKKSKLSKHLNKFRDAAVGLWGKRYEIARGIVKNIKENKWQHIGNTAATLTMGLGMMLSTGGTVGVFIAGYAVYSAAGNYVWPIITEAQKMREKAKEKNKELGFWQSIKEAHKAKKDDPEYKRKGRWGLVGGAVGAIVGGAVCVPLDLGVLRLDTVTARLIARLGRTISTSTAQLSTLLAARRDLKKDPSDANRSKLKSARRSFWVGLTLSALLSRLGINSNGGEEISDTANSALSNIETDSTDNQWATNWTLQGFQGEDLNRGYDVDVPLAPEGDGADVSAVDLEAGDVEVEVVAPQVGDEIFRKEYGNGIVETKILGEEGKVYQQVSGLTGGTETSESVQRFYERRIENMNQYNHLVEVLANGEGGQMTANEAVAAMKKQIAEGFVVLPEGVTPEHAIHTAFMHAHYTGDKTVIMALSCPNGEDTETMFAQLVHKYSTNNGFIGRPVDPDYKAIMRAGTVTIEQPCEVTVYEPETPVKREVVEIVEVVETPITIDNMTVTWAPEPDATVEYPTSYAGANSFPRVGDQGFSITPIDNGNDILTARVQGARSSVDGYLFTDGDRVELSHEREDGVLSYQRQRSFNVLDGYSYPSAESVADYTKELGGAPNSIIEVVNGDQTTYQYVGDNGVTVTFDPNNNYGATISAISSDGKAPIAEQQATFEQALTALKEHKGENLDIKAHDAVPESALTEVRVRNNGGFRSVFARFSETRSK